jgi:3-hydroxyacyl-[acyl-carrier-protein] dehydratase
VFHFLAVPGDTLRYTTTIETIGGGGANVKATSHVGDRLQAEADIMFAHLDDTGRAKTLFEPKNFVFTMKLLGVFDVGRTSDGKKLTEPPGLAKLKGDAGVAD